MARIQPLFSADIDVTPASPGRRRAKISASSTLSTISSHPLRARCNNRQRPSGPFGSSCAIASRSSSVPPSSWATVMRPAMKPARVPAEISHTAGSLELLGAGSIPRTERTSSRAVVDLPMPPGPASTTSPPAFQRSLSSSRSTFRPRTCSGSKPSRTATEPPWSAHRRGPTRCASVVDLSARLRCSKNSTIVTRTRQPNAGHITVGFFAHVHALGRGTSVTRFVATLIAAASVTASTSMMSRRRRAIRPLSLLPSMGIGQ